MSYTMKLHLAKINWSHLRNNAYVYCFMLKAFVLLMLTIIIKESVTSCILAIFLCLNWHLWCRVSCWSMNTSSDLVNVINGNHREEETVKKKKHRKVNCGTNKKSFSGHTPISYKSQPWMTYSNMSKFLFRGYSNYMISNYNFHQGTGHTFIEWWKG